MTNKYWLGKKRSEETKRKISQAQIGRKQPKEIVEKRAAGNRKHGKSRQCYNYKEWRRQILERDNGKCVKCGNQHEKMHCHHIISWKDKEELRFSVDNGETLCASCHIRIGKENKEIDGSETQFKKGNLPEKPFKKGMIPWNLDKSMSEETKKKVSEAKKGSIPWNKGKPMTEETRKKVSEAKKGSIAWNKGIPATEEQKKKCGIANLGKNRSPRTQFKKGMIPWNKGKNK